MEGKYCEQVEPSCRGGRGGGAKSELERIRYRKEGCSKGARIR